MASRGRKSAASLAVANASTITTKRRTPAPAHLGDVARSVWARQMDAHPAGTFGAKDIDLLAMYCQHVAREMVFSAQFDTFDPLTFDGVDPVAEQDKLSKLAERESRAASSLATRLRITRQAVDHPTTAGRALKNDTGEARKPWESDDDE